jgi:hypothetical protein
MQNYNHAYDGIMSFRAHNRYRFSQLVGEHAVRLTELAKADAEKNTRKMMSAWADISKLNDEWASLIASDEDSEFATVTRDLLHRYTEALGDYILDKAHLPEWRAKIAKIVELESKFFQGLGCTDSKEHFIAYTSSVINMVDASRDSFHDAAAGCIKTGTRLGCSLDVSLRRKK